MFAFEDEYLVCDSGFPNGQADQQERCDDSDVDADFLDAGHAPKQGIYPRPYEHGTDDKPCTYNGHSEWHQF